MQWCEIMGNAFYSRRVSENPGTRMPWGTAVSKDRTGALALLIYCAQGKENSFHFILFRVDRVSFHFSQNAEIVCLQVVWFSSLFTYPILYSFNSQVNDLTQEVSEIRREVSSVLEHPISEDSAFIKSYLDDKSLARDSAVQLLVDKLSSREIERSIHLVRAFREKLGGEAFGSSDEDNLDCLVSFYCKHVAEKNVGSLVMSGPLQTFASLCRDLMEVNVAILAAVEDLNS